MLAEIVARLDASVADLKTVQGAAEFAALRGEAPPRERQPAAYVLPLVDAAGRNDLVNAIRQNVVARFGVVLALGNLRDPHGATASVAIEGVRDAVRDALLGWAPTAEHDPVVYAGGRMVGLKDGVVWWQDDFTTAFSVSSV